MTKESGKVCPKCGDFKAWEEFFNNKAKTDGKTTHCKVCHQMDRPSRAKPRVDVESLLPGMKRCRGECGEVKHITEFALMKGGARRYSYCGDCEKKQQRDRYASKNKTLKLYPNGKECEVCKKNKPIKDFKGKGRNVSHQCSECASMPTGKELYCPGCKTIKPIEEFHKNSARGSGVDSNCRQCKSENHLGVYLWHYYKITLEQYEALLVAQNHVCAVCKQPETMVHKGRVARLTVDHDHACCPSAKCCGKCIRGLNCNRCNHLAGWLDRESHLIEPCRDHIKNGHEKVNTILGK